MGAWISKEAVAYGPRDTFLNNKEVEPKGKNSWRTWNRTGFIAVTGFTRIARMATIFLSSSSY